MQAPENPSESRRETGVQVIARAAEILRSLGGRPDGLTLRQIADATGLPRSTVHRIVVALETEGFVVPASSRSRVQLGPTLRQLAMGTLMGLDHVFRPYLRRLSRALNETVDLAILEHDHVLFIDQVAVSHRLQAVSAAGARFPAYCTANGKALLAALPPDEVAHILPARLKPLTAHTIVSRPDLLEQLGEVRRTGVAFDREEHTLGICGVGCAVEDGFGRLAAITVPLPAQRFYGHEERIVDAIVAMRQEIAEDMNGRA